MSKFKKDERVLALMSVKGKWEWVPATVAQEPGLLGKTYSVLTDLDGAQHEISEFDLERMPASLEGGA